MKVAIYTTKGDKKGEVTLPSVFKEKIRLDLVKRAFLASMTKVPAGATDRAGKRSSATLSRRRKDYKTGYGRGTSRVPRKTMWRRGRQFGYVGAWAPGTTGGRRAHPLKPSENVKRLINQKERILAIKSAIACTVDPSIVKGRQHKFAFLPIVIEDLFESTEKTKDVKGILEKLGLNDELKRVGKRNVRAGKGTRRGRKYVTKKGPLLVVSDDCALMRAARNIVGVECVTIKGLNVKKLAPGGVPGRLCVYTPKSLEVLAKRWDAEAENGSA